MDEPVRWVSKDAAARELEISLSTLDGRIRDGEVEVLREGRRVYVQVAGPEYLSDEELLRRARARTDELEEVVRRWERIASELERERDEAKRGRSWLGGRVRGVAGVVPERVCGARADEAMGRQACPCRSRAGHRRARGVATAGVEMRHYSRRSLDSP